MAAVAMPRHATPSTHHPARVPTIEPMTTQAIRDVELVSTGTHAASTGMTTVTRADLEAMLAAHADGLVDHAPVKLGHRSSLNDGIGDGAPAYGWVIPKRIVDKPGGVSTLVGDLVGMPAQLAAVAPTAYRRRSVEIAWKVKSAAGKAYAAVLAGVALLGVTAPAVKGLSDVVALYNADPALDVTVDVLEVVDGLEAAPTAVAMLAAARNAGATTAQLDAMAAAAGARDTADVQPPSADDDKSDPQQTTTKGVTPMPKLTDAELRAKLGLEADADVDAALKGILAEREEPATPPVTPPVDPAVVVTPPVVPAAPATPATPSGEPATPSGEPATPAAPVVEVKEPELVTLSAGTYADVMAIVTDAKARKRTEVLEGAQRAGKITADEVTAFGAAYDNDPAGTATLLSSMAARFPVSELGSDTAAPITPDAASEAELNTWETAGTSAAAKA